MGGGCLPHKEEEMGGEYLPQKEEEIGEGGVLSIKRGGDGRGESRKKRRGVR